MKRILFSVLTLAALTATSAFAADWNAFVIRKSGAGNAPAINVVAGGTQFVLSEGGMKAALGSNLANGLTVGDLAALSIVRVDDYTRFTAGSGPAVGPYLNLWVTDGAGKYAVISNEPSNAEWQPNLQWNMTWEILKTKTVKVYENNDKSWLPNSGVGLTFNDLAGLEILAPSAAELAAGWPGMGSGAPREFGTNAAYGVNWVFGDTLSNYVASDPGYIVSSPSMSVPEPASLALLGLGAVGLLSRRRRM